MWCWCWWLLLRAFISMSFGNRHASLLRFAICTCANDDFRNLISVSGSRRTPKLNSIDFQFEWTACCFFSPVFVAVLLNVFAVYWPTLWSVCGSQATRHTSNLINAIASGIVFFSFRVVNVFRARVTAKHIYSRCVYWVLCVCVCVMSIVIYVAAADSCGHVSRHSLSSSIGDGRCSVSFCQPLSASAIRVAYRMHDFVFSALFPYLMSDGTAGRIHTYLNRT